MASYSTKESKQLKLFGDQLRALRHERRYSQEQLAEHSGLHRTYVSSAERGERNVSLINIFKLASALNVKATDLLKSQ